MKYFKNPAGSATFYCFSPPVMLATFVTELVLLCYTVCRYKMTTISRLVVLLLAFLATFQISEYFVCGGMGLRAMTWSRVGYVAITALPPLGLHLLHAVTGKPARRLVLGSYVCMAGFMSYFLLAAQVFSGYECTGNYVIFQLTPGASVAYFLYYYLLLFGTMGLGLQWIKANDSEPSPNKPEVLRAIQALIVGYCVFLVPTAIANSINPATRRGIPSIMCGFAVLFAIILVTYLLPRVGRPSSLLLALRKKMVQ